MPGVVVYHRLAGCATGRHILIGLWRRARLVHRHLVRSDASLCGRPRWYALACHGAARAAPSLGSPLAASACAGHTAKTGAVAQMQRQAPHRQRLTAPPSPSGTGQPQHWWHRPLASPPTTAKHLNWPARGAWRRGGDHCLERLGRYLLYTINAAYQEGRGGAVGGGGGRTFPVQDGRRHGNGNATAGEKGDETPAMDDSGGWPFRQRHVLSMRPRRAEIKKSDRAHRN